MKYSNNIDFKNLRLSGVKKDSPEKMDSSFFADVYTQAKSIIASIVECNSIGRDIKGNLGTNETQNSINNVMAFIGRRGTGKTSAMLSVAGYFAEGKSDIKDKAFYTLPYTDVSVFEENEDAFIITLSKMFAYLSDMYDNGNMRSHREKYENYKSIRDRICTVYDHYVSFKGTDIQKLNSSYNLMEKVEHRHNVHSEFEKLVKDYIELLNSDRPNFNEGYLIICLDDIDMTRYNHINIMQCIHQFFMIPNVIVMVTMRVPVLSAVLQKEFFTSLHTVSLANESNLKLSREQQEDYIRKIIPSGMRITMPSWRKRDYQTIDPIKIVFNKDDYNEIIKSFDELQGSKLFKNYSFQKDSNKSYSVSPKELIMIMLSDRTEIYLDSKGRKYHFMEPDSLRNLYDLFYLMYNMESDAYEDSEIADGAIKSNCKIILDYLHFKMLPESHFKDDIMTYINDLLQEPIDRRGEKIWNYYFKCLNNTEERKRISLLFSKSFYKKETRKYKIEKYSMGEIYRVLYFSSRLGLAAMNKHLVEFILASFSFALPLFIREETFKIGNTVSYSNSSLCNLFGYTLIGEWRKDLFNGNEVDIVIDYADMCSLFNEDTQNDKGNDKIGDFFKKYLCLILLTSKAPNEVIEVSKERYNYTRNENEPLCYHFEINADPTAFIINSLDIDERFDKMLFKFEDESIDQGVSAVFDTIIKKDFEGKKPEYNIADIIGTVKEEIKNELQRDKCNLQFLLEQTDLSYNIIKRSVSNMIYVGNNLKAKDHVANNPMNAIKGFYNNMEYYLDQQDKVYFLGSPENGFAKKFKEHSFVKFIKSSSEDDLLSLRFSENYYFETLGNCLDNLQDKAGGPLYTDIQSFKQFYKDDLNRRVGNELRSQIAVLIESYRNGEFTLGDTLYDINRLLDISFEEPPANSITLLDCLSILETDDGKFKRDITYISLQFKSFINTPLTNNEVTILLSKFKEYAESKIDFNKLLEACYLCMLAHQDAQASEGQNGRKQE